MSFLKCGARSCSGVWPGVIEHECLASRGALRQQWGSAQIKRKNTGEATCYSRCGSHNCRNLFWIYWFQFHTSSLLMPAVSLRSSSPPVRLSFTPPRLEPAAELPLLPNSSPLILAGFCLICFCLSCSPCSHIPCFFFFYPLLFKFHPWGFSSSYVSGSFLLVILISDQGFHVILNTICCTNMHRKLNQTTELQQLQIRSSQTTRIKTSVIKQKVPVLRLQLVELRSKQL